MLTQLNIIHDQRGFTVQVSTTHQTQAGALAHLTELLTQFTHDHNQAASRRAAQAAAAAGGPVLTDVTDLPHRWEGPGHNGQPIEAAPVAGAGLVATTAKPDEETKPPAVAPFRFGMPGRRRSDDEEPPF